ncbi:hypothetical protein [Actinokineospora diospyrosa]|uniref:Uncharacterized protein n=1 Tax=Actinokineospora diospyrosa TaxID=103728 RepID=A0ABT1I7C7_9PSEU|nr:hypothetical protein [Actinokineospora diospyrosa]MCP2268523.1 hypothetical protein [Actinokineospora diospyrosa]
MATPVTAPHSPAARVATGRGPLRERAARPVAAPVAPTRLGTHLRAAIERVLTDPTGPAASAELMAGLAWTAAAGETCLITRPVEDVRTAIAAADPAAARVALEHALAGLQDAPVLPVPRPAPGFERRSI